MTLLISLKDKIAKTHKDPDFGTAFRQIETWANAKYPSLSYNRSQAWTTTSGLHAFGYNNKVWDFLGAYNTSTGVFTVPYNGIWRFTLFNFATASAANQQIQAFLNGSIGGVFSFSGLAAQTITTLLVLTSNQPAGNTLTTQYNCNTTGLTGGTGGAASFTAEFLGASS